MASGAAFRMFYGTVPATAEQLRRVEEITVEQEMEAAWEARIRLSLCLDDRGAWRDPPATRLRPFSRIRIELKLGSGAFRPLIDGSVAGYDTALSSQPGVSTVNVVVRDDSVLMNREEGSELFENRSDAAIAREVFGRFPTITSTMTGAAMTSHPATVRRGTPMGFLRQLARANGYLAYVLPGEIAGTSRAVFDAAPTRTSGHPPLVLLGAGRNLQAATFREDSEGPERSSTQVLSLSDQRISSARQSFAETSLMGDLPVLQGDQGALRQVPPEETVRGDGQAAATGQAQRASYAMQMQASLVPGCYGAVLSAYDVVTVRAGTLPQSGDWLLHKVTHRITPSLCTQEIEAKRNAQTTTTTTGAAPGLPGGLF